MSRVLVVEPDRQIRKFIAGILADFGHHVQTCRDVADAHRRLGRTRFDVLATDLALDEGADDFPALVDGLAVLTLSGRLSRPTRDARSPRLNDKPFRLTDLRLLVAAIEARQRQALAAA